MMKYCFFIALGVVLLLGAAPVSAAEPVEASPPPNAETSETNFDPVIDDLPLMEGLTTVPDAATLFTAPHAGRIAESMAEGEVAIDDVYAFYRRALPHLGWKMVGARAYRRGAEKLSIDAHTEGKMTVVRFSIKPD